MKSDIKESFLSRINEIIKKLYPSLRDTPVVLQECFAATLSIYESIYGSNSLQIDQLLKVVKQLRDVNPNPGVMDDRIAKVLQGGLLNLKAELESGLIEKIFNRAVGSAIADFVFLAEKALSEDQKDVSAVLASAALEDTLKRKAEDLGLEVEDKNLSDILNALKTKSFFPSPQHNIVKSYVDLRNKAMHAQWNKIFKPDVASLIAFLKSYILEHFE